MQFHQPIIGFDNSNTKRPMCAFLTLAQVGRLILLSPCQIRSSLAIVFSLLFPIGRELNISEGCASRSLTR